MLRPAFAFLAILALAACVNSPPSRSLSESNLPVTLAGVTGGGGESILIQAVDQNTGALHTLGHATSSMSGMPFTTGTGKSYTVYPWSFDAGVLDAKFWSPQTVVADVASAQGHLEIFASAANIPFVTFSKEADDAALASGADPAAAAGRFSDGTSTVLFDQSGVGFGAEGPWTPVQGMVSNPPMPGPLPVAWSVGYYTVEGNKKIYALICTPKTGGPYPVAIFNHGGLDAGTGGNLNGAVTASGWTSQPMNGPDSLGQCIDWAKRGWIFALSSYRGENVNISSTDPAFPAGTWTSTGHFEFCMGEVTDVLALADLLKNHAATISVGGAGQMTTLNSNGKLFMYGYSHGGCITWRAVEQGAPVDAFSVIEGFTDLRLNYLMALQADPTHNTIAAAIGAGAYQPNVSVYQPDASGVMGYNWRSAHYFAQRGDLALYKFKAMPILILQGDDDTGNPVPLAQAAEIANDIGATNIFVGPNGVSPASSQPCVAGANGAPLPAGLMGPNATCPVSYVLKDTGDPCVNTAPPGLCSAIALPLLVMPGQPVQQHYLVVYHKMNHINGGLAIKNTFNGFVSSHFMHPPGCDGLVIDCATD